MSGKFKDIIYNKSEILVFAAGMLIMLLATYKYVAKGETYEYKINWDNNEKIEIDDGGVSQDIVIDPKAQWSGYSYAVYLQMDGKPGEGSLAAELIQNDTVLDTMDIGIENLESGWYTLSGLNYSSLNAGYATVRLSSHGTDSPVYVGIVENTYNVPDCEAGTVMQGRTLAQRYHINFSNKEHKLRILAYILLLLVNALAMIWIYKTKEREENTLILQVALVISFLCFTFIYDNSIFLSPTWAETVTNFLDTGMKETVWNNIAKDDSGYLPLFQRLIALLVIKTLKLDAYHALYAMQIMAYVISGIIFSFPVKKQYKDYFGIKYRYLLSIMLMMLTIHRISGAFINFIVYGVLIIFFYFLADSGEWTRGGFVALCVFAALACVSKGVYVTVLPYMLFCVILFHKSYSKRDYIFSASCSLGVLVQLIYYFSYGINAVDWTGKSPQGSTGAYYGKMFLQAMTDVPSNILGIFYENIELFNGIALPLIIAFWVFVIVFFVRRAAMPWLKKTEISRNARLLLMPIIYIFAQALFLRISVYGVSEYEVLNDKFWSLSYLGLGDGETDRYQVQIFIAVAMLFFAAALGIQKRMGKKAQAAIICILLVAMMTASPRLQLKGLGNDKYVSERTKLAELRAEIDLFKRLESNICIYLPIQPGEWYYGKNANVYCIGEDINSWAISTLGSDEPQTGDIILSGYDNINTSEGIFQVFIKKKNLIERSNYEIELLDDKGNVILRQSQDNSNYQLMTSFTFFTYVPDVSEIRILDGNGNVVNIENSLYVITYSPYFKEA